MTHLVGPGDRRTSSLSSTSTPEPPCAAPLTLMPCEIGTANLLHLAGEYALDGVLPPTRPVYRSRKRARQLLVHACKASDRPTRLFGRCLQSRQRIVGARNSIWIGWHHLPEVQTGDPNVATSAESFDVPTTTIGVDAACDRLPVIGEDLDHGAIHQDPKP